MHEAGEDLHGLGADEDVVVLEGEEHEGHDPLAVIGVVQNKQEVLHDKNLRTKESEKSGLKNELKK